jgi:large subunit ribosomal protein L5
MVPRLKKYYKDKVIPFLKEKYRYKNIMEVPKLHKIVINVGLGKMSDAGKEYKIIEDAANELSLITGQKPVITKAKKSIAGFKLREDSPIGCMVTLRGTVMYEFFDRLVNIALPRVRDFRGTSSKAFDGRGNYTLGLREQIIFPEIDFNKVDRAMGMNISIVTTSHTDEEARDLLLQMGMPISTR